MNDLQIKQLIGKLTGVMLHKEGMAQVAGQGEMNALHWHRYHFGQGAGAEQLPNGLISKMQGEMNRWRNTHMAFLPEDAKQQYESTIMVWYAPDFSFDPADIDFLNEQNDGAFLFEGDAPGHGQERKSQALRSVNRIKEAGVPLWMSPEEWQAYSAGRNDKHQHFNGSPWHLRNTCWAWGGSIVEDEDNSIATRTPVLGGGNGFFTPTQLAQWEMNPDKEGRIEKLRTEGKREAELVVAQVPAGDAYGLFYRMNDDGSLVRVEQKSSQGLRYLLVDTLGVSGAMPGNTSYFLPDVSNPNFVRVTPGPKSFMGMRMPDGSIQAHFGTELNGSGYKDCVFDDKGQPDKSQVAPPRVFQNWPQQIIYRNGKFEAMQQNDPNPNNDLVLALAGTSPAEQHRTLPQQVQNGEIADYIDPHSKGKADNQNVWYLKIRDDGGLFWAKKNRGQGWNEQMHPLSPVQIERLNRYSPGKIGLHCFIKDAPVGKVEISPANKSLYEMECKHLNNVRRILVREQAAKENQINAENQQRAAGGQPLLPSTKKRTVASEEYHIIYVGPNWLNVSQPQKGVAISRLNTGDKIHDQRSLMQDSHRSDLESRKADNWQVHRDEYAPSARRQEREGFKVATPVAGRSTAADSGFSSIEAALGYFYKTYDVPGNERASAQDIQMAKAALQALHEYMENGGVAEGGKFEGDYGDVLLDDDEEQVAPQQGQQPPQQNQQPAIPQGQEDQRMLGQMNPQQQQPNALNLEASNILKKIKKSG